MNVEQVATSDGGDEQPYVFISYASVDRERVLPLVDRLERAGIRTWIDREGILGGTNYAREIVEALRGSAALLIMCSRASFASQNVRQEIALAWKHQRPYLPLLLEPVSIPADLEYWLEGTQWIEVVDDGADRWLERSVAAIGRIVSGTRSAAPIAEVDADPALRPVGLPEAPTRLLGRETDLAPLLDLVRRADVRLVTLTGAGGIGKTRLALEVGRLLTEEFPDGVAFVDLASITDTRQVGPAIATGLGLRPVGNQPPEALLSTALGSLRILLILDNFEQLLDATPLVATVLGSTRSLKILVTSRAPLHLRAEHEYPVSPLQLPPDEEIPLADLADNGAVALFTDRAEAAKPGFLLDEQNAQFIAEICRRLDGIPLAIELAAARIRMLPPPALLRRLEHRLPLLAGGARDLPARQQTLRATIDWSYGLLSPEQQRLFRYLAVFAGGSTLEAAEFVAGEPGGQDVLDLLTVLIDQSLVQQRDGADDEPHFTMLETIREYALEQLADSDDVTVAGSRHADYFAQLADRDPRRLRVDEKNLWIDQLDRDAANLSAALGWALDQHDDAPAVRISLALAELQWARARVSEARNQVAAVLERVEIDEGSDAHTRLLEWAISFARIAGDLEQARAYCMQALEVARRIGEPAHTALMLQNLGVLSWRAGDLLTAQQLLEEALAMQQAQGDDRASADTLMELAMTEYLRGDHDHALTHVEQSIEMQRSYDPSAQFAATLQPYAWILIDQGKLAMAAECLREGMSVFRLVGMRTGLIWTTGGVARLAAANGDATVAARLAGAAATLRSKMHVPLPNVVQQNLEEHLRISRDQIGETRYQECWDDGAHLSIDEMSAAALAYLDSASASYTFTPSTSER
ncbi:MAG TPA: TIR domain-containing protein [Thermomicrobiales bacterium]|nr:TIR domain-containing protein [Thermomicrobiales bacterium]